MILKLIILFIGLGVVETILVKVFSFIGDRLVYLGLFDGSLERLASICETAALICFSCAAGFFFLRLISRLRATDTREGRDAGSGW